jgi:hypothetical protein
LIENEWKEWDIMYQKLSPATFRQNDLVATTPYLDGFLSGAVFDLDATIAASYGGSSQTWANLINAPADGTAKTAGDFYRGVNGMATATDPTFTGSVGSQSAYWLHDGFDAFFVAGGNTALMESLHKTTGGSDYTFIAAFRFIQNDVEQRLFSTQGAAATTVGITVGIDASEHIFLRQRGDTAAAAPAAHTGATLVSGMDYLIIVSYSGAANNVRFWVNARDKTDVPLIYNTSISAPAGGLTMGARYLFNADFVPNLTRVYQIGLLNAYIGDAEASQIADHLNARHGRIYA